MIVLRQRKPTKKKKRKGEIGKWEGEGVRWGLVRGGVGGWVGVGDGGSAEDN